MSERRFTNGHVPTIETRADGGESVVGYAAVFHRADDAGTEYELWQDVVEWIAPGAFSRAITEGDDARALFNHDASNLLGRVGAGTVRVMADDVGLRYEIDVPDTQVGRDVVTSIKRGDLTGSSFSFTVERATWIEENGREIRQIDSVRLFDVGPVTYPAYAATTTGTRSGDDEAAASYAAWKKSREDIAPASNAAGKAKRATVIDKLHASG